MSSESSGEFNVISAAVVLLCVVFVGSLFFMATPRASRHTGYQMKNSGNLRGIAQSMVIYGNSNNDYWPGLSANGEVLSGNMVQSHGTAQTGASFHARMWVLVNSQFFYGDMLLNPRDSLTKWTSGSNCTSTNVSYAGLQIGDSSNATATTNHTSRAAEWKNNANSQAIVISDRLLNASDSADAAVQSVWTTSKGDWKGNLVWGDGHAGFEQSCKGFTTRYQKATNTNDNLFVTASSAGVMEGSVDASANAMMVYY